MVVDVKVVPRSASPGVAGAMADGSLKVKVSAPPEQGKANAELCRLLAAHFGVPAPAVRVIAGAASTRKKVEIKGL